MAIYDSDLEVALSKVGMYVPLTKTNTHVKFGDDRPSTSNIADLSKKFNCYFQYMSPCDLSVTLPQLACKFPFPGAIPM